MSETKRKSIVQPFYDILVIVLCSILSGLGYGFLAGIMGVNDMGPMIEQMLFSYFIGGVAAALFLTKQVHRLKTFGGSILVAILTTILISIGAYDLMAWFSGFVSSLAGESFLVALLTPLIISILVYASLRLIKAKQLSIQP